MNERTVKIVRWAIIAAMPFFLGFSIIRLIIGEAYPRYEYSKPDFPPDRYGFTTEERLELALVAVDYLSQPESPDEVIYMLEEQRLPGTDQPLYNEREIEHMIDVKNVTDGILRVNWVAAVIVLGGLALLLARPGTRRDGYRAIMNGGVATTVLLLGIAGFILLGWELFFVQFHQLLFPPGSWTFSYNEGLIRLFPERFWFDIGLIMSGGTLLAGVVVALLGYALLRYQR